MFCDYLAEIRMLDNEVGMTLRTLEETGQLDNTLVIFLGEQGPKMPFGKWTCYRYGQHSAFLARYPQKIKAGSVSDALAQYEDVLPTLIDFAGGAPVDTLDGRSLLKLMSGSGLMVFTTTIRKGLRIPFAAFRTSDIVSS